MAIAVDARGLVRVSSARRWKNRVFTVAMWSCAVVALIPLILITTYVVARGYHVLSVTFFTKEPSGPLTPQAGGIAQAFIGTALIVGMASLFSIPLGVMTAVYLAEYGRGRYADGVRLVAQVLLSTPSIVAGAFIWSFIVVAMGTFSAFAAAVALTVLMWPVIALATEQVLRLVPQELREGALALGLPRWKVILRVVVPTAGAGILTAIMLAVSRGLGETAPILLTALGNDFINTSPFQPTDALPLRILNDARTPVLALHAFAWGAALMLLVAVLGLSIGARVLSSRQQKRMA